LLSAGRLRDKAFLTYGARMNKKGQMKLDLPSVILGVVLLIALIPVINSFASGNPLCLDEDYSYLIDEDNWVCCNTTTYYNSTLSANQTATNNLSATERTVLGLTGLLLILGLVFLIGKQAGLIKKK